MLDAYEERINTYSIPASITHAKKYYDAWDENRLKIIRKWRRCYPSKKLQQIVGAIEWEELEECEHLHNGTGRACVDCELSMRCDEHKHGCGKLVKITIAKPSPQTDLIQFLLTLNLVRL